MEKDPAGLRRIFSCDDIARSSVTTSRERKVQMAKRGAARILEEENPKRLSIRRNDALFVNVLRPMLLASLPLCLWSAPTGPSRADVGPTLGFARSVLPMRPLCKFVNVKGVCSGAGGGGLLRSGVLSGHSAVRRCPVGGVSMQQKRPSRSGRDEENGSASGPKKKVVSDMSILAKDADENMGVVKLPGTPLASWFAVALLLGINIHNQWTRALVYYLVSFKVEDSPENNKLYMNKDLSFGEEQYSLLASFGFTTLYTAASLFAGRAADKYNRATMITLAAALWSVSTAANSIATSFDSILGLRALSGVTQAFVGPQAYGLIASYFSGTGASMATANSIYASGVYVGGALASLSILLDGQLGWRDTSLAAGGIGLVLSLGASLTLKDPRVGDKLVEPEKDFGGKEIEKGSGGGAVKDADGDGGLKGGIDAIKRVMDSRFVQVLFLATAFR